MLILFHGEDQNTSRTQYLNHLKSSTKQGLSDHIDLDGKKITSQDLIQSLESSSLFDSDRIITIQGLLSRPQSKQKKSLLKILAKSSSPHTVLLWETKQISKTILKKIPLTDQKLFKTKKIIFDFLDSVTPLSRPKALKLLEELFKSESPEMVLYHLERHFCDLHFLSKNCLSKKPTWIINKLKKQLSYFKDRQATNFYFSLSRLESDQKTGNNLLPLGQSIIYLICKL